MQARLYLLPLIILIEGFASIAVEILTIRQLLPVAGGSVVVTSLIIGVFLLFLALGYDRGGRVQYQRENVLRWNFFITSMLVGVGLSYVFIESFFSYVQHVTGYHAIFPLVMYLLLILAPIVFLLGQTLPISMNIVRQDRSAGVIAGKALGLSTVGSFLGAIVTTVILMHFLGVAVTVLIVSALLMSLSVLLCPNLNSMIIKSIFVFFAGWLVYILNVSIEKNVFVMTTSHGNYQIVDQTDANGLRYLIVNNSMSSKIDTHQNTGFDYIERIKKIIFDDLKLSNANILVLGAAGFTLSQTALPNFTNHFTYVDIESRLNQIVVPGFIRKIDDEFIVDDARHYVRSTDRVFHAIVVDVYSGRKSIPMHLLTREFMRDVKARLDKNGVAIFNVIANPRMRDLYSKRVDNTLRSVFGACAVMPGEYIDGLSNVLYVCNAHADPLERTVYTDNRNAATVDSFYMDAS